MHAASIVYYFNWLAASEEETRPSSFDDQVKQVVSRSGRAACLGLALMASNTGGGKPPFCIDRGHPRHLFGDMVNTFGGVEFLQ